MNCTACSKRLKNGDEVLVGGPEALGGMGVLCARCCKRRKVKPTATITKDGFKSETRESTWEDWMSRHWEFYGARENPEMDMPEAA